VPRRCTASHGAGRNLVGLRVEIIPFMIISFKVVVETAHAKFVVDIVVELNFRIRTDARWRRRSAARSARRSFVITTILDAGLRRRSVFNLSATPAASPPSAPPLRISVVRGGLFASIFVGRLLRQFGRRLAPRRVVFRTLGGPIATRVSRSSATGCRPIVAASFFVAVSLIVATKPGLRWRTFHRWLTGLGRLCRLHRLS
jgi:hypothetical protein